MTQDSTLQTNSRWTAIDRWLVLLLALLGATIFGWRMDDLTIRGEESRRALVATEMLNSGDWVVPRLQNELYFSRPPLQNWLIALAGQWRGSIDETAIRWYSCLATTLTSLTIFFYCRSFMTSGGAFVGALSFLTTFHILELGHLGETEALFTFLLSSSLLIWHMGELRNWNPATRWCVGYSLAALATLAKGPQAPVYFCGSIGVYLLLRRDWKCLFHPGHLLGICSFVALVGSWLVPYGLQAGWESVPKIFMDNVGLQFAKQTSMDLAKHMATYPFEILACLLPWSPFLLSYGQKSFRDSLGEDRSRILFCIVVMVLAFPSLWLVPGAQTRYYMPIYPFFAPLVALSIQGCWQGHPVFHWQHGWKRMSVIMSVVAGGLMLIAIVGAAQPTLLAGAVDYSRTQWTAIVLAAGVLAGVIWTQHIKRDEQSIIMTAYSMAAVLGIIWTAGWMQHLVQRSISIQDSVVELERSLPKDIHIVSLNDVDHKFAFYFGRPIGRVDREDFAAFYDSMPLDEKEQTYICFKENADISYAPEGFDWTPVASIPTDRSRGADESKCVVLARITASSSESNSSVNQIARESSPAK